jgi:hypothetical protein
MCRRDPPSVGMSEGTEQISSWTWYGMQDTVNRKLKLGSDPRSQRNLMYGLGENYQRSEMSRFDEKTSRDLIFYLFITDI